MDSQPDLPTQKPAAVRGGKAVRWLMAGFAGGLILVTALAVIDRGQVRTLETFSSESAVGDSAYYKLPPGPQIPADPVATLDGKALYVTSREKRKIDDAEMIRAGYDETTALNIYTPRQPIPGKRDLFLKIDIGEYIPVAHRGQ